jgi:hypothetical protein
MLYTISCLNRVKMAEDGMSVSGAGSTASFSGSNDGSGSISSETSRLQLLQEMRKQNFDTIRFASYRTACKMRFIQKKVNRKFFYTYILIHIIPVPFSTIA